MTALVLLSGGLDSTVAAALWREERGPIGAALFVDYGQRALLPERQAAAQVAEWLGVELLEMSLPAAAFGTQGALLDLGEELPSPDLEAPQDTQASADAVWVPNRNGLLVNLAAAVAEARGLETVVVGFNAEEAATFPDNGIPFIEALNACLALSTRGSVRVAAPCQSLDKAQLLAAGRRIEAPVDCAWSCYGPGPEPCERCESCLRRRRAERSDEGAGGSASRP